MTNYLHKNDLPSNVAFSGDIAVDTETKGLNIVTRDRLCVVQLSDGKGDAHVIQFSVNNYAAPNLKKILSNESVTKIFHYARFDIAALKIFLGLDMRNVYCTKIASKLVRTYTDKHGLKDLCKELLNVELSKQQQSSNWAAEDLSKEQIDYAASDVLHLHKIRDKLNEMLRAEARVELAKKCFDFLPTRVELDIKGWADQDIFAH